MYLVGTKGLNGEEWFRFNDINVALRYMEDLIAYDEWDEEDVMLVKGGIVPLEVDVVRKVTVTVKGAK